MFEVGKTYKTRGGTERKLVAILSDGHLIVEGLNSNLSYRSADGRYFTFDGTRQAFCAASDLIDPAAMTSSEREGVCKLLEHYYGGRSSTADVLRNGEALSEHDQKKVDRALAVVREIRKA